MKILFIGQYFPPEMGALASRISELSEAWSEEGCQVTVLTGFPNYPSGVVPIEYKDKIRKVVYKEKKNGYVVVRTWLTTLSNDRPAARVLGYLSFFISSIFTGLFLPRPDVIIASSPPLTVGLSGWLISKIRRIPYVFEIRDLWPESITASGVSSKNSLLIRGLRWMAEFLYRNTGHIVVVSPAFKTLLANDHQVSEGNITNIPNGVRLERFEQVTSTRHIRQDLGLEGKLIVSYIGNYGWAQGLGTVVESAKLLKGVAPEIVFLFVGGGADEEKLKAAVLESNLQNVVFIPQQPQKAIPEYIQASDICLVPLRDEPVFQTAIPSKMFEYMAGSRPVILGVKGQALKILDEAKAGIAVAPENPSELAEAIRSLSGDKMLRDQLGQNGREFVSKNYNRQELAMRYLDLLREFVSS